MPRASSVTSLLALLCSTVASATPVVLVHSGRLLGPDDQPVSGETRTLTFRLLDADVSHANETEVWQGTACEVTIEHGHYTVALGGDCGTGLLSSHFPVDAPRYLEVAVDDVALSPRLRIGAIPVAAHAANADAIAGLGLDDLDARYVRSGSNAGSLELDGTVTAQGFIGDGSGLTGLTPAQLDTTQEKIALSQLEHSDLARLGADAPFQGEVSANRFVGDGSGLTGIRPSQLDTTTQKIGLSQLEHSDLARLGTDAVFQGQVTATRFVGDGSGLTGLPASVARRDEANTFDELQTFAALGLETDATTTCDSASTGRIRWNGTRFEGCTGEGWATLNTGRGHSEAFPARTCRAILEENTSATDGLYWVDPDGEGGKPAFRAFCDMAGGGFTLVANIYDSTEDDVPNNVSMIADGWQQLPNGNFTEVVTRLDKRTGPQVSGAVAPSVVKAMWTTGSALRMCLVSITGREDCRSTENTTLSLAAAPAGTVNDELKKYVGGGDENRAAYTYGRLAGLPGSRNDLSYASFSHGNYCVPRWTGVGGVWGGTENGLCEHKESGWQGVWHGWGSGVSFRPWETNNNELGNANSSDPHYDSYGFRLYVK